MALGLDSRFVSERPSIIGIAPLPLPPGPSPQSPPESRLATQPGAPTAPVSGFVNRRLGVRAPSVAFSLDAVPYRTALSFLARDNGIRAGVGAALANRAVDTAYCTTWRHYDRHNRPHRRWYDQQERINTDQHSLDSRGSAVDGYSDGRDVRLFGQRTNDVGTRHWQHAYRQHGRHRHLANAAGRERKSAMGR